MQAAEKVLQLQGAVQRSENVLPLVSCGGAQRLVCVSISKDAFEQPVGSVSHLVHLINTLLFPACQQVDQLISCRASDQLWLWYKEQPARAAVKTIPSYKCSSCCIGQYNMHTGCPAVMRSLLLCRFLLRCTLLNARQTH